LSGRNTYINTPFNNLGTQENAISRIIKKIADDLKADKPTRAVLLIPIFEGMDGHRYETQARKAKFLEIGTFPVGSFCFVAPEAFSIGDDFTPGPFQGKVGLYLAVNKFSLKIDPIDWDTLTSDIKMWSQTACRNPVTICLSTIEKFKQRVPLGYRLPFRITPSITNLVISIIITILALHGATNSSILRNISKMGIISGY
jgi:hypothetical protein